jgi:hypothetical protein
MHDPLNPQAVTIDHDKPLSVSKIVGNKAGKPVLFHNMLN